MTALFQTNPPTFSHCVAPARCARIGWRDASQLYGQDENPARAALGFEAHLRTAAETLCDTLPPKLLSGKLRVTDIFNT